MKNEENYDRLQKDVEAVKADISKLAGEIANTVNDLAGVVSHQTRRKYNQARSSVDTLVTDVAKQGQGAVDTAHDTVASLEETLEDIVRERPLATIGLTFGLGFLIGATWRR
jgi:ElaB/YqjD/DUF883 family membrane-anchored ribosome-binding protein